MSNVDRSTNEVINCLSSLCIGQEVGVSRLEGFASFFCNATQQQSNCFDTLLSLCRLYSLCFCYGIFSVIPSWVMAAERLGLTVSVSQVVIVVYLPCCVTWLWAVTAATPCSITSCTPIFSFRRKDNCNICVGFQRSLPVSRVTRLRVLHSWLRTSLQLHFMNVRKYHHSCIIMRPFLYRAALPFRPSVWHTWALHAQSRLQVQQEGGETESGVWGIVLSSAYLSVSVVFIRQ